MVAMVVMAEVPILMLDVVAMEELDIHKVELVNLELLALEHSVVAEEDGVETPYSELVEMEVLARQGHKVVALAVKVVMDVKVEMEEMEELQMQLE
jgi:hypothetical protein